jgi:hypothetical protein
VPSRPAWDEERTARRIEAEKAPTTIRRRRITTPKED